MKKKKNVIIENFKSLEMLLDTMEKRPCNAAFKDKNNLTSERISSNNGWHGTETYNQALEIIKSGYSDPLEKMKKAILKIGEKNNSKRPRMQNDVVGFVPHVPNALMNLPETMINQRPTKNKAKTINLIYNFCVHGKTSTEKMIKAGTNFIGLVNSLEKEGYRVKIDIVFVSITDKTEAAFTVKLKEYGQSLNLLKLAYPLVHPSMLRRTAFKWLETTPELKDKDYLDGYGIPFGALHGNNLNRETKFLKDNYIIPNKNSFYCNVEEAYQCKDIKELSKTMGLK